MSGLDHAAMPCFDVRATHAFYADALGFPLLHASTGSASAWGHDEYLLLVYGLPAGGTIDFFHVPGLARPAPDGLPRDIRHVAITVASRPRAKELEQLLRGAGGEVWTETHAGDDLHVYAIDPNGLAVEFVAVEDGVASMRPDPAGASRALAAWNARHDH